LDKYSTYNDEQLLTLLRENEPIKSHAFRIIWDRHSDKLMQYCRFSTTSRDDAQDLFQNTWISFFEIASNDTKVKNIKFNLFKIAHYKSLNKYKESKRANSIFDSNVDSDEFMSSTNLIEEIEYQELIANFHIAVNCLEFSTAQYLLLHWIAGLNFREIADLFEVSYDSVRMKCTRGMSKVIDLIKPKYNIKKSEDIK